MRFKPKASVIAAALLASSVAALAANTTFFTSIGDLVFPFKAPTASAPGTIDNMTIGATTPEAGSFSQVQIDQGTKTATASSGAATLNKDAGVITSESLSTAAGATYTLTLTDSSIAAADQVMASVALGTATTGTPAITTVKPAAGSVVIVVQNIHASAALNGTIKIAFVVFKN
jgi:hypothetical protein